MRFFRLSLLALVFFAPVYRALAAEPVLKIISPDKTLTFTAAEFAALPRTELKLPEQGDQKERHFAGVSLRELLSRAGAPLGDKMRGAGLMTAVIVRCKDNYSVLFSLAEFDESFSARTIILADQEGEKCFLLPRPRFGSLPRATSAPRGRASKSHPSRSSRSQNREARVAAIRSDGAAPSWSRMSHAGSLRRNGCRDDGRRAGRAEPARV